MPADIYDQNNWASGSYSGSSISRKPTASDNLYFKFAEPTYLTNSMENASSVAVCNEVNFNGGTCILVGTIRSASTFRFAQTSGKTVNVEVAEGGTLYSGGYLAIGCGGTATLTVNGGTVYSANDLRVGNAAGSTATLTIKSGTVEVVSSKILGLSAQGTGTINLDGGTMKTKCIKKTGGSSGTLNFNGGTLQANANNNANNTGDFINENLTAVNVQSGGGTIDANGYSVTIAKSLSGEGAMTFKGGGTVTLAYGCDCAGGTTIELGTKVSAEKTATAQKILGNLTIDGRAVLAGGTYDVLVASGLTAADINNITLVNCAGAATVGFDNDTTPTKIVVTLEEPTCVMTSASYLAFPDTTLAAIKYADFTARMCGQWISKAYNVLDSAKGYNKKFYYDGSGNLSSIVVEFQVVESGNTKCVVVEFTDGEGGVYAKALGARYIANKPLGYEFYTQARTWNGTQKTVATSPTAADYGVCDIHWTHGAHGVTAWMLDADTTWSALRNGAALASDEIVQITVTDADAVLTVDENVNVGLIELVDGSGATLKINEGVTVSAESYSGLGYVLNNGTFQKWGNGTVALKFDNASRGVFVVNSGTLKAVGKRAGGAGTPITGDPDVTPRSTFLIDVKSGATYDVNGQTSVSACVRLAQGAHFISSGSVPDVTWGQTLQLILAGDAGVTANGIFGLYTNTDGAQLDFGSHTLEVNAASGKQFMLANTTITGDGTISVVSGKLAVRNNYDVIGADCTVSIGSGGTLHIAPSANKLSVKNFVNGGAIDSTTKGTLEVAGTLIPGSAAIPKLTLASGATVKATGTAQTVSTTFSASGTITVDASEIDAQTLKAAGETGIPVLTVPAAFIPSGITWKVSGEQVAGTRTKWRTDADDATKTLYIARPSGLMVIIR